MGPSESMVAAGLKTLDRCATPYLWKQENSLLRNVSIRKVRFIQAGRADEWGKHHFQTRGEGSAPTLSFLKLHLTNPDLIDLLESLRTMIFSWLALLLF